MTDAVRGLVLGVIVALVIASCMTPRRVNAPRLTGTCEGVCAHYIACKPGHPEDDRARCETECPIVFGADRDALMSFESLSCRNAVEYIDGMPSQTAGAAR